MIREYKAEDLESIMAIWLAENQRVHNFINPDFFKQNYELVKFIIPMSKIYVQDIDGVKGFIGLTENYISGLFIDHAHQHQGLGTSLIAKAKQLHNNLSVHVYKKNNDAIAFYLSQGFAIADESINEETGEVELLMQCSVEHSVKIGKCAL